MKQKKIPLRKCTGCGEMKPKRELVRVVKAPDQKDENGVVTEIHCTYDPATRSGECERKVKGTLHWLCAEDAVPAEFRLYESLMAPDANPDAEDFIENINKNSLETKHGFVEPMLAECKAGERYQFMRIGYFAADADHTPQKPVFNRTVGLKDSFKIS